MERASIILSKLENKDIKNVPKSQKTSKDQLSIENFAKDNNIRIVQKIKDINLDDYTAREALELLYKIKEELR